MTRNDDRRALTLALALCPQRGVPYEPQQIDSMLKDGRGKTVAEFAALVLSEPGAASRPVAMPPCGRMKMTWRQVNADAESGCSADVRPRRSSR